MNYPAASAGGIKLGLGNKANSDLFLLLVFSGKRIFRHGRSESTIS
jgi:hypothetical protein